MLSLVGLIVSVALGATLWFLGEYVERQKSQAKIKDLQNRLRFSDSRVITFKEQLVRLQNESQTLKEALHKERETRIEKFAALRKNFKRNSIYTSVGFLTFGLVFGGSISGLWVKASTDHAVRTQLSELHVVARVAEMNAKMFSEQVRLLNREIKDLRNQLDHERVEKAVVMTKLRIVLDSTMDDKWKKVFTIDPRKLDFKWNPSPSKDLMQGASTKISAPVVTAL